MVEIEKRLGKLVKAVSFKKKINIQTRRRSQKVMLLFAGVYGVWKKVP